MLENPNPEIEKAQSGDQQKPQLEEPSNPEKSVASQAI